MIDSNLYQTAIIDYAKKLRFSRGLADATHYELGENALCGDKIKIEFVTRQGKIIDIGYKVDGCVIHKASTAWLAENILDKSVADALSFLENNLNIHQVQNENFFYTALHNPTRTKCVTLSWHTAKLALHNNNKVVKNILKKIYDPELPVNIYDLGLIYNISADINSVNIIMTLTTPNCPVADSFPAEIKKTVQQKLGIADVTVDVTFDPPWTIDKASAEARILLQL